jgi:general secretion pathway protein A
MRNYAILVGIDQQNAELLINGQRQTMALEALGQRWTGSFTLVWHKPSRFETAIAEGSSGPLVTWLAQQFSQLDQQAQALAEDLFNARLSQRVMIFQRNHALKDDGVVGLKTLLKLNEAMGIETTTLSDATTQTTAANQPRVEGGVL